MRSITLYGSTTFGCTGSATELSTAWASFLPSRIADSTPLAVFTPPSRPVALITFAAAKVNFASAASRLAATTPSAVTSTASVFARITTPSSRPSEMSRSLSAMPSPPTM